MYERDRDRARDREWKSNEKVAQIKIHSEQTKYWIKEKTRKNGYGENGWHFGTVLNGKTRANETAKDNSENKELHEFPISISHHIVRSGNKICWEMCSNGGINRSSDNINCNGGGDGGDGSNSAKAATARMNIFMHGRIWLTQI